MMKLRQYVNAVVLNVFSSMNALDAGLLDDQRLIELKSEVCNMFLDSRAAASVPAGRAARASQNFQPKNNTSIRAGGRTNERGSTRVNKSRVEHTGRLIARRALHRSPCARRLLSGEPETIRQLPDCNPSTHLFSPGIMIGKK